MQLVIRNLAICGGQGLAKTQLHVVSTIKMAKTGKKHSCTTLQLRAGAVSRPFSKMGSQPLGPRLAGRLTAELIMRSPQYMSCANQYELDLRGA